MRLWAKILRTNLHAEIRLKSSTMGRLWCNDNIWVNHGNARFLIRGLWAYPRSWILALPAYSPSKDHRAWWRFCSFVGPVRPLQESSLTITTLRSGLLHQAHTTLLDP